MSAFKTWLYAFHSVKGPAAILLGPLSRKLTGTEISGALKDKFYSVAFFVQLPAIYLFAFFYAKNGQEVLTAYCVAVACGSAVTQVLEIMSGQMWIARSLFHPPTLKGYLLLFIISFAAGIAINLCLFWLATKYFGYHPWYMLLIGLVILLLSLGLIKIGSDSESAGSKLIGGIGAAIGGIILYITTIFICLLLGVCINLLPLFGIVWAGSFFMESLNDHVMYWPNFWGFF